jgi:hypothetical protein
MTSDPASDPRRDPAARHVKREDKIARLRQIERQLEKMELEDESNDPELLRGHIRLTRGVRMGCGALLGCAAALAAKAGHASGDSSKLKYLVIFLGAFALVMILRGLLYRPDVGRLQSAYRPHRGSAHYMALVEEMNGLARGLAEDLEEE